jgi:outer membrane protein assembly factor BamD
LNEVVKTRLLEDQTKNAAEAYDRIITRYPAMDRALDAKARLEALHQPVPRPTRAALDLNKKEIASRQEEGIISNMLGTFEKGPDVSHTVRMGEPTMVDQETVTATGVVNQMSTAARGGGGDEKVGAERINGTVAPNQPTPRSDAPAPAADSAAATTPAEHPAAQGAPATAELRPTVADPNELKPNVEPDTTALPPLQQTNQLEGGGTSSSAAPAKTEEMADISSSKKKKKKGLKKLNPF